MIIYKVTNKINNKVYIGQTILPLKLRKSCHISQSKRENGDFYRAIRKYGKNNFIWEVLDDTALNQNELDDFERKYIKKYNSIEDGYNINDGGKRGKNIQSYIVSEDYKIDSSFVNIKIRKEYRDMIKEYSKTNGYKMYALIEGLIKEKCTKRILYSNQT